ncbi:MAG TPA: GTPase domain-containing protein [Actinomycetes bacterium]|nr:GTPase domain-containing protein [Actinomycetes bacterium]
MLENVTTAAPARLLGTLEELRARAAAARLPLEIDGADRARDQLRGTVSQLEDYVLPRLSQLEAPLLAVVGGPTGAGKSTLVNSIAGRQVSAPGVLRPTTRVPVLVCHPADEEWFSSRRVLPGLLRISGSTDGGAGDLQLRHDRAVPRGLALLDAPDIDSIVTRNRQLAAELLAAADLWIFVTTAARYADAVPWDLLISAQERNAAVAVVLDRVPAKAANEVVTHLAALLSDHGLGDSPLFVVPESPIGAQGMLPRKVVEPLRGWLHSLAADLVERQRVVRRTLDGVLASLDSRLLDLAGAADGQVRAVGMLRTQVETAYHTALQEVEAAFTDGSLLRGEVLARWQEFVGTPEVFKSLQNRVGRIRDRIGAAVRGQPQPGASLQVALGAGVEALIVNAADHAAETTIELWRAHPAGAALLSRAGADLGRSNPDLPERAAAAVHAWQAYVRDLVRSQGMSKRATARFLSFGINGVALLVMLAVFASTAGLTGTEVGVAAGSSALSHKLLEAIFGDQAVRSLAADARKNLVQRIDDILADEARRFTALLDGAKVDPNLPAWLRGQHAAINEARAEAR